MSKIVVYTAITGHYDTLKEPPAELQKGVDFVAFLDYEPAATSWQVRPACSEFADPCRNAKFHKMLPHLCFPEAEYSVWIDGSIQIDFRFPVAQLIEEYLKDYDFVTLKHPCRQCIYEEAAECIRLGKDDPPVIQRQMAAYRHEGFPANLGLAETGVILRRHTAKIRRFNEAWHDEIKKYSRRDQLSFNYVAHKMGMKYGLFEAGIRPPSPGPRKLFSLQPHEDEIARQKADQAIRRLSRKKACANRLILACAILNSAWILAAVILIFQRAASHPADNVPWRWCPLALMLICGLGASCFWRGSLKRQLKEAKARLGP